MMHIMDDEQFKKLSAREKMRLEQELSRLKNDKYKLDLMHRVQESYKEFRESIPESLRHESGNDEGYIAANHFWFDVTNGKWDFDGISYVVMEDGNTGCFKLEVDD